MKEAKFFIGQIVHHKLFNYRGVVFGVDPTFNQSEEWYETMAMSRPPKDEPWYEVMVDGAAHTTYVAERNLEPSEDTEQIEHPMLGHYFDRYDGKRYYPNTRSN